MRILTILFVALMLMLGTTPVWAALADSEVYPIGVAGKALDGSMVIAEAPFAIIDDSYTNIVKDKDCTMGLFRGIHTGLTHTFHAVIDGTMKILKSPLP